MASAHGNLQSLLKNPELNSLVGGTISVTLGDYKANDTNGGNKVRRARSLVFIGAKRLGFIAAEKLP